MRYDDFAIEIRQLPGGGYRTHVKSSTQGEGEERFKLPISRSQLQSFLRRLDRQAWRLRLASSSSRELDAYDKEETRASQPPPLEHFGEALYSALFRGEAARVLHSSLGQIHGSTEAAAGGTPATGLRLRFVLKPDASQPELAGIPWELLRRPDTREQIARSLRTPIVRYLEVPQPVRSLRVRGSLKVLLVESAPRGADPLATPEEALGIRQALAELPHVEVKHLPHATLASLSEQLEGGGFHILHFMGHGHFDRETGEAQICLEDSDGKLQAVQAPYFAEHVKQDPSIRLVVLNACATATPPRESGQDPFTATAAALTLQGIPAVVAMQFPISDRAAVLFATRLYQSLARGAPVDAAVAAGRLAICDPHPAGRCTRVDWATPVVYLRTHDSVLVDPAASQAGPGTSSPTVPAPSLREQPLRLGVRSLIGHGQGLEDDADRVLDLTEYFDGRHIRDEKLWHDAVLPRLSTFLRAAVSERRPLILDLAAHYSIAFAAGLLLEAKSGVEITVVQRGLAGRASWLAPRPGELVEGPLWSAPMKARRTWRWRKCDVAVAVSVTHPIFREVTHYVRRARLPFHRLLGATISPTPSQTSVRDGAHALRLAQVLSQTIRSRSAAEREGTLHLFAAAPNALLVFLGQLAPGFGRVIVYEYDLESGKKGDYWPGIRLPAPSRLD